MIIFYCYHYSEFEMIKFEQPIVNVADRKKKKYEELQEKEHEHEVTNDYKQNLKLNLNFLLNFIVFNNLIYII